MGLFSPKKHTPDEILELINSLPEEDRAVVKTKLDELYRVDDKGDEDVVVDAAEVENAGDEAPEAEVADDNPEEVVADDEGTEAVEETPAADDAEAVPDAAPEAVTEEPVVEAEEPVDPVDEDNTAEMIKGLTDKVNDLVTKVAELTELKTAMEEFTKKQRDSFGYRSEASEKSKPYEDMTADELKAHILNS